MAQLRILGSDSTDQNNHLDDYLFNEAELFPLRPNCKTGYYKNLRWKYPENNSGDLAQLERWQRGEDRIITHNPEGDEIGSILVEGCQWGLNCGRSNIVVVDIDVKEGKLGLESLEAVEAEFGPLPRDCVVESPSGGIHIYLSGITSSKNAWRDGIDIKSHGGMVMAAGCFTPDGQYTVEEGSLREIPQAPRWLLEDEDICITNKHEYVDGEWRKITEKTPNLPKTGGLTPSQSIFQSNHVGLCGFTTQAEVDLIWAALHHVPSSTHDNEFKVMVALKNYIHPEPFARQLFDQWSRGSKYATDHDRQWREAYTGPVNIESLYHLADRCGWNGLAPIEPEFIEMCRRLGFGGLLVDRDGNRLEIERASVFDFQKVAPDDPAVLLGEDRFLERGSAAILSAGTGIGKSTMIMQAGLMWSVGQPALGIPCNGPLRILLIQAENGEGDIEQARSSVVNTMMNMGKYTADDMFLARDNFQVLTVRDEDGNRLPINFVSGNAVGQLIQEHAAGFDLVVLDNLFSYAGCGVSEQAEMTNFLRLVINPVITSMGLGLLMVHHGNKAAKYADLDSIYKALAESAQSGSGSGDIANWARASLEVLPLEVAGHYVLMSGKRGRRIGWKDELGQPVAHKMVRHAEQGICWLEVGHAEVDDVKEAIEEAKPKKEKTKRVDWAQERETAFGEMRRRGCIKGHSLYEFMSTMNGKSPRVNADNLHLKAALDDYGMAYLHIPMNKKLGIQTNYHLYGSQKDLDAAEIKIKSGEQLDLDATP